MTSVWSAPIIALPIAKSPFPAVAQLRNDDPSRSE